MRALAIALGLAATSLAILPAWADETTHWRLFVADHAEPVVTAIELADGAVAGRFELEAPATLYTTASRAAVFAVQGAANRVSAITSGIAIEDHGDHGDIDVTSPELLEASLAGERPVHFVEHHGQIAVFFDGSGQASVIAEGDWLSGNASAVDLTSAAPHHGVAAPMGDYMLLTRPNADDPSALPVGIDVIDPEGAQVGELHPCPDLHGEASSGNTLAIACATGLLLATQTASGPQITHLPYPSSLPDGKSTTLLGGVAMQYWLGNYGADKVVIIDPSAEESFRLVDLPARRVHFAIDPVAVTYAYIFTENGKLNRLDVLSGEIDASLDVTAPYSMDGEWSLPRPRIAVAGGEIAVTDPLAGQVHLVDAGTFTLARTLEVDGMPYNVVAIGASGETHD
jgi:hypothetical protein